MPPRCGKRFCSSCRRAPCHHPAAGREVPRAYGDGDPARLKRLHGRFTAMVIPGTSIQVEHAPVGETDGARQIAFRVLNADGEEAVSQGVAVVA